MALTQADIGAFNAKLVFSDGLSLTLIPYGFNKVVTIAPGDQPNEFILKVFEVPTGNLLKVAPLDRMHRIDVSRDGKTLAVERTDILQDGSFGTTLVFFDLLSGQQLHKLSTFATAGSGLFVLPDGKSV